MISPACIFLTNPLLLLHYPLLLTIVMHVFLLSLLINTHGLVFIFTNVGHCVILSHQYV